jgi:hypothetical protein
MHLFDEVVEDPHAIAGGEQLIGQVRADEASSARDQDLLCHPHCPPFECGKTAELVG